MKTSIFNMTLTLPPMVEMPEAENNVAALTLTTPYVCC